MTRLQDQQRPRCVVDINLTLPVRLRHNQQATHDVSMRASIVDQVDNSTGQQGWNKVEDRAVCGAMTDEPHRARATDRAGR